MKNKTFLIKALSFILFISINSAQAQIDENNNRPKHQVGLSAGNTSGIGFSYRYWPGKIGLQLTATPPWLEDGKLSYFNGGVSLLYSLIEVEKAKFFMYGAASYVTDRTYSYDPFYSYYNTYDQKINAGLGLGFDIFAGKHLGFNFQGGYGMFDFANGVNTGLAAEAGLYFKFYGK